MSILTRETAKAILIHGDAILLTGGVAEPIWTLPGGGLMARESPEQALRRELREEVGLSLAWCAPVTTIDASWQPFGQFKDTIHETMHLFCGQLTQMGREGISMHERSTLLRWFPLAHVMPMQGPQWQVRPLEILRYIVSVGGSMAERYAR